MNLRNLLFILLLSFTSALCAGNSPQNDTRIKISVKGIENGYFICRTIQVADVDNVHYHTDSVEIRNGEATLIPDISHFSIITLLSTEHQNQYMLTYNESNEIILFANPNDKIEVKAERFPDAIIDYTADGNQLNTEYSKYRQAIIPFFRSFNAVIQSSPDPEKRSAEIREEIDKTLEARKKFSANFYDEHLDSPLAPFLNVKNLFYRFPEKFKEPGEKSLKSPLGTYYLNITNNFRKQKQYKMQESIRQQTLREAEKHPAPDFTLPDTKGNEITLSSFKGEYIVLDFWYIGCMFCPGSMEQLNLYSKKYPGKFKVMTINIADDMPALQLAEKNLGMENFINVSDREKKASELYKISSVPALVLIRPDGKPQYFNDYGLLDQLFGNAPSEKQKVFFE